MRKIYYLFLTMLLGMVGMTANAEDITVTVNVDDASRLKVYWTETDYSTYPYTTTRHDIEAVGNVFTAQVPQNTSLTFECTDGYLLNNVDVQYFSDKYKTKTSIYFSANATVNVTTFVESEVRTRVATINADDYSRLKIQVKGSFANISLSKENNTYKYIPEYETGISIGSTDNKPLYEVKYNGEVQSAPYGYYDITFNKDATSHTFDIKANAPAGTQQTVKISYADATKADGFITEVTVDGSSISKDQYLAAAGFKVDWGAKVAITGDANNFKVNSFKVNNESSTSASYSFNATEDYTIVIDAEKYKQYSATINVADPAAVKVQNMIQNGYNYSYTDITLSKNGDNTITVSEKNPTITIAANDGYQINSVTLDGVAQTISYGSYNVTLTDGCKVVIDAAAIVRDKTLTVNIDDKSNLSYFQFTRGGKEVTLNNGENKVEFCDADLPIQLNSSAYNAYYFFNKMKIGSVNLTSVNNGDVLDVYFASTPKTFKVSITIDNELGMNGQIPTLTTSLGEPSYWQYNGIEFLDGAEATITMTPVAGSSINVKVDGNDLQVNTEGNYVFTVNKATTVEITKSTGTGINSINAENADNAIYTLQGVKVNGKAKGLYIKNGKKVVVK